MNQGYKFKARFVGAPVEITIEFLKNVLNNKELSEFVEIVGPLYGNDKVLEFEKADIFVYPTYSDAFPLSILEAMQFGLHVISTIEGGIPDMVIDNETGLLVEPNNVQMIADKIAILLKDEKLRRKLGRKGYDRFMRNYTFSHFENNMNQVFNSILGVS
jgi:glycosyltransferase involved in cell wall biosynthesis